MDLRKIWSEGVNWIHLVQDKNKGWAHVNTLVNFQVSKKKQGIS
jgi:hypothetical protein